MAAPTVSALARKFKLQIDIDGVPTWTDVLGVTDFKNPVSPSLEDDGVYDDGGWGGKTKTGLEWTVEAKLIRRHSVTDVSAYDTGQEKLRALSLLFGASGVAHVRFYDRDGGPEAYEGYAEVTWQAEGGKRTDLEMVTVTLTGKGALTAITNPVAVPTPVPTVTALSVITGAAAGGTQVVITGDHFIGVTFVKFGATSSTQYVVVSPTEIVAVSPAHAAGSVQVNVTNAAGVSADTAADNFLYT